MITDATIPVLDHGFVRLVDYMGNDTTIANCARVSTGSSGDTIKDAKLIRYLMREGHTSPFEHVAMTFHIKAPLFVIAQWQRHRHWSYNQESMRYREIEEPEFYVPTEFGVQSTSNKQGREGVNNHNQQARDVLSAAYHDAVLFYEELLDLQVPRELARMVLPTGIYTEMYATAKLWNVFDFIRLRETPEAQAEIRQYAAALHDFCRQVAPVATAAFDEKYAHE